MYKKENNCFIEKVIIVTALWNFETFLDYFIFTLFYISLIGLEKGKNVMFFSLHALKNGHK